MFDFCRGLLFWLIDFVLVGGGLLLHCWVLGLFALCVLVGKWVFFAIAFWGLVVGVWFWFWLLVVAWFGLFGGFWVEGVFWV